MIGDGWLAMLLAQQLHIPIFMKKDPSLEGGFVEIFQRELPMTIRSQSLAFEDQVMLRVFKNNAGYKLELTSQSNVSFLYVGMLSAGELCEAVGKKLEDVGGWFRDIFSGVHRYYLEVSSAQAGRLWVEQQQKFKSYELASFQMEIGEEWAIRDSISFRFQRMRVREKMLDSYWQALCGHIRAKNPSVLLQLEQRYKKNAFK